LHIFKPHLAIIIAIRKSHKPVQKKKKIFFGSDKTGAGAKVPKN
jgi:hypothetical protein